MAPAASTNSIPPRRTTFPRRCTISSTPVVAAVTVPRLHLRTPVATSETRYNSVLEQQWRAKLKELEAFKARFGHTNVPDKWEENRKLGVWVSKQRAAEKQGQLKEERKSVLHRLGFEFRDIFEEQWRAKLKELKAYKTQFGHTNVPYQWQENRKLAKWVSNQRTAEKQGQLKEERKKVLHRLGFEFDGRTCKRTGPGARQEQQWWTRLKELEAYKTQFGHTNVPQGWQENRKLGAWVQTQRAMESRGQLEEERKNVLHQLGFQFRDFFEEQWRAKLKELKAYKTQFGHTNVPYQWQENRKLGSWVQTQRTFERRGQLKEERKKVLQRLGFEFDRQACRHTGPRYEQKWRARLKELEAYKARFGHPNVPQRWGENKKLATWVHTQRQRAALGKLSAQRKRALDDLGGFEWIPRRGCTNNRNSGDDDDLHLPHQSSSRPKRRSSRTNTTVSFHEPDLTLNNDTNLDAEEDDQTSSLSFSSSSRLKRRNRRNATSSYDELNWTLRNDGSEDNQDDDEEIDDDDDDDEEDYDDGSDNEGGDSDLYNEDNNEENHDDDDDGEVQGDLQPSAAAGPEVVAIPAAVAPTTTSKRNKGSESASSWEGNRNHSGVRKFTWRKRARFSKPILNRNPSSSMGSRCQPPIAGNQEPQEEGKEEEQQQQEYQEQPSNPHPSIQLTPTLCFHMVLGFYAVHQHFHIADNDNTEFHQSLRLHIRRIQSGAMQLSNHDLLALLDKGLVFDNHILRELLELGMQQFLAFASQHNRANNAVAAADQDNDENDNNINPQGGLIRLWEQCVRKERFNNTMLPVERAYLMAAGFDWEDQSLH